MRTKLLAAAAAAPLLAAAPSAKAVLTTDGTLPSYLAAGNPLTDLGPFAARGGSQSYPLGLSLDGVAFAGPDLTGFGGPPGFLSGEGSLTMTFPAPVHAFAFYLLAPATWDIAFSSEGGFIQFTTFQPGAEFFGYSDTVAFVSISITSNGPVDLLTTPPHTLPEPPGWPLLGLGALVAAVLRPGRSRRARSLPPRLQGWLRRSVQPSC